MKKDIGIIVGGLPPPGKLKKGGPAEDAKDGGADDAEETDGEDYSAAEDSAGAFAEALGLPDADPKKVLDAFRTLLKNADTGE